MKRNQFLLLKLMEECAEVAQRASKQIQFGALETQNGQGKTNAQRLKDEILDLVAVGRLLQMTGELPEITDEEYNTALIQKRAKLNKYLNLSNQLGQLPEITI